MATLGSIYDNIAPLIKPGLKLLTGYLASDSAKGDSAKALDAYNEIERQRLGLAAQANDRATSLMDRYDTKFVPAQDRLLDLASRPVSPEVAAGKAAADVEEQLGVQRGSLDRTLSRAGVAPNSGAAVDAQTQLALKGAAARAGAATKARRDARADEIAGLSAVNAMGSNLPGLAANLTGQANNTLASIGSNRFNLLGNREADEAAAGQQFGAGISDAVDALFSPNGYGTSLLKKWLGGSPTGGVWEDMTGGMLEGADMGGVMDAINAGAAGANAAVDAATLGSATAGLGATGAGGAGSVAGIGVEALDGSTILPTAWGASGATAGAGGAAAGLADISPTMIAPDLSALSTTTPSLGATTPASSAGGVAGPAIGALAALYTAYGVTRSLVSPGMNNFEGQLNTQTGAVALTKMPGGRGGMPLAQQGVTLADANAYFAPALQAYVLTGDKAAAKAALPAPTTPKERAMYNFFEQLYKGDDSIFNSIDKTLGR